jgi:hypothetical protein
MPCLRRSGKQKKCLTVFDLNNSFFEFIRLAGVEYNDMIHLLAAIGLSPGGSTHLHTNNT